MKKFLTATLLFLVVSPLLAQVGINADGSSPDPSAMLDVKSSSRGLLAPRVALEAIGVASPVTTPAVGLLVYNTATAGAPPNDVIPGYYCWNGSRWIPVLMRSGASVGDMLYWNGTQYVGIPVGLPGQYLQLTPAGIPAWQGATYPSLTTSAATNISTSGAMSGGTILSDGGSAITAKGVCYNTAPNPTILNLKVAGGSGSGNFSSNITGLSANTTYYVRAFATNSAGTSYGNEISFTTLPIATLPSVTTTAITNITSSTASGGGNVTNAGGANVTARGVCWSTSPSPTIADSKTINGSGTGGFVSSLSGLSPNTLYHVRAYATNSVGTAYGSEYSFTTLCSSYSSVGVTIVAQANPVCSGQQVTFTAIPVNGGANPAFQWKVNGSGVTGATSATYAFVPADGDSVSCTLTSGASCVTGNPATSNSIIVSVLPLLTAGVTITAGNNPVCAGTSVAFTAVPSNGGSAPSFQWRVNGNPVSGATSTIFTFTPVNNDAVTCAMTSNAPCVSGSPALSNTITMTVTPVTQSSVSVSVSANPVCAGSPVTFTAVPVNGGTTPVYQWKVNGVNAGTNSPQLTFTPADGDSVRCILQSSLACSSGPAGSNMIVMAVNPLLPVSVSVAASQNPFVSGTPVTFTATPVNGGATPAFQWKVNNANAGGNANTFTYVPANGDTVRCVLISSLTCMTGSPATSNAIAMVVANGLPCAGTPSVTYGGKTYNTVQIGNQCWFRENLNIGTRVNGSVTQTNNAIIEKYCYNDLEDSCTVYGGLYQWNEMMQYVIMPGTQGICPAGWHIPSDPEWTALVSFLGGADVAGGKMKEAGTVHWITPNNGASNTSGFTALGGGYRRADNGLFSGMGSGAHFYSSTDTNTTQVWKRYLGYDIASVFRNANSQNNGFSVRCLKDCPVPAAPVQGTHVPSPTQIIWKWNSVQGATGYKWSNINNYSTATDVGTALQYTETGLTCNTSCTRFVWAYSGCGSSPVLTTTQLTSPCPFPCGQNITVNHVAGTLAPVSKTALYGTVANIPGEEGKCWITRNLGADRQALSVGDGSEASSGWYWQFNRKQGYRHDGTVSTPSWTITGIFENSAWLAANDPCSIELGASWRVPTQAEYFNIDNAGGWTNWTNPYNSALKLHAGGCIGYAAGSLYSRGSTGYYWSSTMSANSTGHGFQMYNGGSGMVVFDKAYGFPLRCINDNIQ